MICRCVVHKPRSQSVQDIPIIIIIMIDVLLVLEIFLTEDSWVEDLLCDAPACSEACLFASDDLLHLWLQSVQYDLQMTLLG